MLLENNTDKVNILKPFYLQLKKKGLEHKIKEKKTEKLCFT